MGQPRNGLSALALALGLAASSCSTGPQLDSPARSSTPVMVRSQSDGASRTAEPSPSLTADQQILHVLNRLGYGPRPGDLERVRRMGLQVYVGQQLNPRHVADTATDQALASY